VKGFRIVLPGFLGGILDVERILVSLQTLPKETKPALSEPQPIGRVRHRFWPDVRFVVPSPRYAGTRRFCPSLAPRAAIQSFKLAAPAGSRGKQSSF